MRSECGNQPHKAAAWSDSACFVHGRNGNCWDFKYPVKSKWHEELPLEDEVSPWCFLCNTRPWGDVLFHFRSVVTIKAKYHLLSCQNEVPPSCPPLGRRRNFSPTHCIYFLLNNIIQKNNINPVNYCFPKLVVPSLIPQSSSRRMPYPYPHCVSTVCKPFASWKCPWSK